jgi:1-acyl-sn-glycerol-3-phosphate acyltransferase
MRNANPVPQSPPVSSSIVSDAAKRRQPRLTPVGVVYGVYVWLEFALIGVLALLPLLLLPSLARRRALVHVLARLILRLAGIRLESQGLSTIPRPCVLIANHSSYIDGVVLAAALSGSFTFVIKHEMAHMPLAGTLLRRIGAEFIERRDRQRSANSARRLLRQASGGQALVFFPEGTFSLQPGLLPFHGGAFTAAARARLPLVPVAIRGTRDRLPPGSFWPHPGRVSVQALPAHTGDADRAPPQRAAARRAAARAKLLAVLGEPDLAPAAIEEASA